jgi:formate/nitrite transporter FocA (FNT family)
LYISYFVGSQLLVAIVFASAYYAKAMEIDSIGVKALANAKGKQTLTWARLFFRGILCYWLVCMPVWLAMAAKDVVGKVFAIFFPIMAFVANGYEP